MEPLHHRSGGTMGHEYDLARGLPVKEELGNAGYHHNMHINVGLIDQPRPRTSSESFHMGSEGHTPCESPGGSGGGPDVSRKQRHNLREQRRILRIGSQFDQLKKKLEAVHFISNKKDKHSILQATIEYIAALERDAQVAGLPTPLPRPSSSSGEMMASSTTVVLGKENAKSGLVGLHPLHPSHSHPSLLGDMHVPPPPTGPSIDYMWSLPPHAATAAPPPPPAMHCVPELVTDSSASFRHVFLHASIPSLVTRLDCVIVDANYLFHELFNASPDDLRMHTLYSLTVAPDVSKMQTLVAKILSCEVNSAQSKMTWHCGGMERHVFVSLALVRDHAGQAVNLQCSILPLA
ncbi:Aste57867_785 [Aphanomyces stellatus]|uniref:Aste57867_785 protein n=1 Tax=Aphanomyces stellatus TaxID=120398 RepID=A0A485K8R2_9STRA|nr:hypothetical protein As57867_000784 [Aphanomyces stellatus]VFT78009.1 Aste57867_785 [Aphanomyces stellatus]